MADDYIQKVSGNIIMEYAQSTSRRLYIVQCELEGAKMRVTLYLTEHDRKSLR